MRIGNFEHNPGALKTVLFLIFLAALLALGTWQMYRAAEKKAILAAAAQSISAGAVSPAELGDLAVAAQRHTLVTFSGKVEGSRQFLWDNRVRNGQAGFEVITPVRTDAGLLLVNRGWVAPGRTRADLPDVSLPASAPEVTATLSGLFSRPSKGFLDGDAFDPNASWPRVLQYFDYTAIEQALGESIVAGVIQPQRAVVENTGGVVEDAQALLYEPNWEPTAAIGPTRHYGYAFQWYAMAVALIILFVVYNTRRIRAED